LRASSVELSYLWRATTEHFGADDTAASSSVADVRIWHQ